MQTLQPEKRNDNRSREKLLRVWKDTSIYFERKQVKRKHYKIIIMGWRIEPTKLGEQSRIIKVATVCVFEKPMVGIEHKNFQYSNTGGVMPFHGIQIDESLIPHEKEILRICGEISDKILELHELVNQ